MNNKRECNRKKIIYTSCRKMKTTKLDTLFQLDSYEKFVPVLLKNVNFEVFILRKVTYI